MKLRILFSKNFLNIERRLGAIFMGRPNIDFAEKDLIHYGIMG